MRRFLAITLFICPTSFVWAQSFQTLPANPVLEGTPMQIILKDVPPNAKIKIVAERPIDGWGDGKRLIYRSEATFTADGNGSVDLAVASPTTAIAPRANTYKNADIRGLFWSMLPTKKEADKADKKGAITLRAFATPTSVATPDNGNADVEIATAQIEFISFLPTLKIEPVDKFPGAIFASLPRQSNEAEIKKRPALIVLGGSEGGNNLVNETAKKFASHGFAVMSLPYYSPKQWPTMKQEVPELPTNFADIEIGRLNDARNYLIARGDIDANKIGIYGISKGAEFVLLAATKFPWVKTVVAIVPTDVVWEGWGDDIKPGTRSSFAFTGKPFAFTPYQDFGKEFMGYQTGADVYVRRPQDKGRAANPAAAVAARIPIENYKGALLIVGGQDDQIWSSGMMAHNIAERRAAAKRETVSLIYSDAGHFLSDSGWSPTTQYNVGPGKSGGTPAGNAAAQADAWLKTLGFLKQQLR